MPAQIINACLALASVCFVCVAGVLDEPCNDNTGCGVAECCAVDTLLNGKSGFLGVCKTSLHLGDTCVPGVQEPGLCGCSGGMTCVTLGGSEEEEEPRSQCLYLPG